MHCPQNLKIPKRCLACFKFMSAKRVNNCFLSVRMASVHLIIFRNLTVRLCTICGAIVLWVLLYLYVQCECVKCIFLEGKGDAFIIMANVCFWRELYVVKNLPDVALWLLQLDKGTLVSSEEKANCSLEVIETGTDQNTLAKSIMNGNLFTRW